MTILRLSLRLLPAIGLIALTACSKNSADPTPHTGDPEIERQEAPTSDRPQAPTVVPQAESSVPTSENEATSPQATPSSSETSKRPDSSQRPRAASTPVPRPSPKKSIPKQEPSSKTPPQPKNSSRSSGTAPGTPFFVYAERVRARTSPEVREGNLAGVLDINDEVILIDPTQHGRDQFVLVEISKSANLADGQQVYVSAKYLSTKKRVLTAAEQATLNYFMVQNIATERLRVYKRCAEGEGCINRMVFESEMVAGQDDDGTRTNVGFYKIQRWEKFYEDGARRYPAWYRPDYPEVPGPGSRSAWFSQALMPNGKGEMRGAFGWYTAIVGPNADAQWTHGTIGWGADKDDFITFRRRFIGTLIGLFTAIRSHGCSRVDNEAISYLRHLLPVQSTIVKIYAKEAARDGNFAGYSKDKPKWDYILTKSGYGRADGQTADAATVQSAGTPQTEWIDRGTYEVDQYPDVVEGNLYDLDRGEFQGVFLVDEGTVVDYAHPKSVKRGGFNDQLLPSFMQSQNKNYDRSTEMQPPQANNSPFPSNSGGGD